VQIRADSAGGIQPEVAAYPAPMNRLRVALEASGSFPDFAAEYLRTHKVTLDFEVPPELLDRFRAFLAERRISPSIAEWSVERQFIAGGSDETFPCFVKDDESLPTWADRTSSNTISNERGATTSLALRTGAGLRRR
jgi:hypothetical protein